MTFDAWLTLGILAVAILFFVTEWLRVDVVAIGVVVLLMLFGILSPGEAVSGFSNTAVLTIAALFIVGGAVLQTGLAGMIGNRILQVAGTSEVRLIAVIMVAVALLSGFMSDTGTVAVLLPAIVSLARTAKIRPSKLLIPLAYGSLLGGAATLIGTPPNLIVAELLAENGVESFGFFSFTPLGVLLIVAGVLFMVFVGRRLLPDRKAVSSDIQASLPPEELLNAYRVAERLFRVRIRRNSPLVGMTIAESQLGHDYDFNIIEITRSVPPRTVARLGDRRLTLMTEGRQTIDAEPDTVLARDDYLLVEVNAETVQQAAAALRLAISPAAPEDTEAIINDEVGVAEVVLTQRSRLLGQTLTDLRFGSTWNLTVLDLRRPGHSGSLGVPLKDVPLAFGDVLLVQGPWRHIAALRNQRRDFVLVGASDMLSPPNRKMAPVALLVLLGMLVLIVSGVVSVVAASMLAALAMVLTRCLTMDNAYDAVDWKSIVLIAGMVPMSEALTKVGVVDIVANGFTGTLGEFGPLAVLVGLFLLTSVFTQVLSNTATTVLLAPIAFAAAGNLDVAPQAFLMSVAVAASMAFATPVASPVNTLVMGAGEYRFADFIKMGVAMIGVSLVIAVVFLPILFPF